MKDIENQQDLQDLVNRFYQKVVQDELISFFFTDIAKVDWDLHLPKMYLFWETLLFGNVAYKGNPMAVHFPINRISAMEKKHFDRWIQLWTQTVDENFEGETASQAKSKARNIAQLMAYKMETARKLAD